MFSNNLPALGIILLLMTAYLLPLLAAKHIRASQAIASAVLALVAGFSTLLFRQALNSGPVFYSMGGWEAPWGIEIAITPLSSFVMLVVSGISALVILSLPGEQREWNSRKSGWYITLVLLLVAALMGITMSNDLFNLYVFSEVSTLAACALVAAKKDRNSTDASFKYLMLGALGSGFVLFAIGITYVVTGHLNLSFAAAVFAASELHPIIPWVISSFFMVGFGIKAGLFPLHVWLPDAHSSAPSTASALLSGVVVKVYAVAMARVFFGLFGLETLDAMGVSEMVRLLAALSIIIGSIFALVQSDIKRMLAYSTVAQIGYIFLGLGLGAVGIAAALYHILAHGLMKAILFLTAGKAIDYRGSRQIRGFDGLGKIMPGPMLAFTAAAMSMIGLPMLAGFATKWYLFNAGLGAGIYWVPVLIIISGLLNAGYFLPIIWRVWFSPAETEEKCEQKVPGLAIMVGILAVIGLVPGYLLEILEQAAQWLIS